jgi:hypothetical protein
MIVYVCICDDGDNDYLSDGIQSPMTPLTIYHLDVQLTFFSLLKRDMGVWKSDWICVLGIDTW